MAEAPLSHKPTARVTGGADEHESRCDLIIVDLYTPHEGKNIHDLMARAAPAISLVRM
jgi:hypothetical protein